MSATVWTAVIAVLALILSQLPPVREMLRGTRLSIIVPEYMVLTHSLGNINLTTSVTLHNTGGRGVTVAGLDCGLLADDGRRWHIPAQTYIDRDSQPLVGQQRVQLFMEWIPLEPKEFWSETVVFFKPWSVEEEGKAQDITGRMRSDISEKLSQRLPEKANVPVEADTELVNQAKEAFQKRFDLTIGNYKLLLAAISETEHIIAVRGFQFSMFESHVRAMRSLVEEYRTGAGVVFPSSDPSKVAVIRLKPISEDDARAAYAKLSAS